MPSKIHPKLRVAVVQAAPAFLNVDGTVDKTIKLMQDAATQGAQLIAFPETWIPGYPWWIWLGSPAGLFAGKSCFELMVSEAGARLVEEALLRIDEGYFA